MKAPHNTHPRILILGGGYVGLHTALRLRKNLGNRATIGVVDPRAYMTYQPFLPEAAAGSVEPRHVVAGLRSTLPGVVIIPGRATGLDHHNKKVTITPLVGPAYQVEYDHVVVAFGSIPRTLPIPGLAEQGIGFKQIEEAIDLRNRVIGKMEAASGVWDKQQRQRMLTFTFVGGGFAGAEALAEIEDMARAEAKKFDSIRREDLRFVLIEASNRILPEVGEELGRYALKQFQQRGIEVKLDTKLVSAVDGVIETSDGDRFESETLVWTAGVKANPALAQMSVPRDRTGRVMANEFLQVANDQGEAVAGVWTAGDVAAVPDLANPGEICGPTAQHAIRQAKQLGDNIAAQLTGQPLTAYYHKHMGTVAGLGLYKGVATVFGFKVKGPLAWFMHRSYHMWAMPTMNRKVHVILDWTMALLFKRQTVALGALTTPREEFHK